MLPSRLALKITALLSLVALPCGDALSRISPPSTSGHDTSFARSSSSLVSCHASSSNSNDGRSSDSTPLNSTPFPSVQVSTAAVASISDKAGPLESAAFSSLPPSSSSSASSSRYSPLALPRTRGLRGMPSSTVLSATAVATTTAAGSSRQSLPRYPTLVLNGDYTPLSLTPLSTWSWQEAVKAVWADKVTMVAAYDEVVRSPSVEIQVPSVIALKMYVQPASPSFCRRNVYLRDRYTCQYCGTKGMKSEMSFDHVTPKCNGGTSSWDNIVTCCRPCNNMKAAAKELATDNDPRLPHSRRFSYNPAWALYLGLSDDANNTDEEVSH